MLLALSLTGWLGGLAKMSWIYKELQSQTNDDSFSNLADMST